MTAGRKLWITCRVSDLEMAIIEARAIKAGRSVSAHVRHALMQKRSVAPPAFILHRLSRIAISAPEPVLGELRALIRELEDELV